MAQVDRIAEPWGVAPRTVLGSDARCVPTRAFRGR